MAIKPVPPLTDVPPFPALADRAAGSYNSMAFAFGTHLAGQFNAEISAIAVNVRDNAAEAHQSAEVAQEAAAGVVVGAAAQAEAAAISAASAADSASAAAAINSAVPWVSGTTYAQFTATISRINFKTYRKMTTAAGGTTDPANDPTNWLLLGALAMPRRARTANVKIMANDISALVDISSGTFTQTFDTPANLGAGWFCYIRNAGTGDITIPDSDGFQNWIMYPNETRLFISDGTALRSVVIGRFYKEFSSTTNFIKPPGYRLFGGEMWSGGNAGGQGGSSGSSRYVGNGGSGGKGGNAKDFQLPASKVPATTVVSVGAGGTPAGVAGGTSSFGALVASVASSTGDQELYWQGGAGGAGVGSSGPNPTPGGSASKGGAGGGGGFGAWGSTAPIAGTAGGVSLLGGNGGAGAGDLSVGSPGAAPGGGGGGGSGGRGVYNPDGNGGNGEYSVVAGKMGGDGARGEVRIWGIA